jgi:release factor glutamine methyltransferase
MLFGGEDEIETLTFERFINLYSVDKIDFIKSDIFNDIDGQFDIIASNPPYIARYEFPTLQKEVLREPILALDGGEDGLDFYRRIFDAAPRFLRRGGTIAVEIGFGQKAAIGDIVRSGGLFEVTDVKKDQFGIDRIILVKWIN